MNTVDIFNTLVPEPPLILLIFQAVEVMMQSGVDIQVMHIPSDSVKTVWTISAKGGGMVRVWAFCAV